MDQVGDDKTISETDPCKTRHNPEGFPDNPADVCPVNPSGATSDRPILSLTINVELPCDRDR